MNEKLTVNKSKNALLFFLFAVLVMGIVFGSVYLAKNSTEMADGIQEFISSIFNDITENKNNLTVFKNSLRNNLICSLIIFFMGFFRFGCIGTGIVILRKGFVIGFTSASFLKYYGLRGMLIMLTTMPTVIITLPALLLFSVISIGFSFQLQKKSKKIIISYIFFLILAVAIFCVASLCEGYLTTRFMKLLSVRTV